MARMNHGCGAFRPARIPIRTPAVATTDKSAGAGTGRGRRPREARKVESASGLANWPTLRQAQALAPDITTTQRAARLRSARDLPSVPLRAPCGSRRGGPLRVVPAARVRQGWAR